MNTGQERLFFESIEEAIDEVCRALGGRKKVAVELWPSLAVREAHKKFDPTEILWIASKGRSAGCHSVVRFIASACGYSEPVAIEPEDERARLQRDFIDAARVVKSIADRIDRIEHSSRGPP